MDIKNIKRWLWLQKEGFAVGTGLALLLYYLKWNLPVKLPGEGITKLVVLIIVLGGIGALIDSVYKPNK